SDIRSRKVDVVVVYKVDRLTRSLGDFAKLVELFETHGVSFVAAGMRGSLRFGEAGTRVHRLLFGFAGRHVHARIVVVGALQKALTFIVRACRPGKAGFPEIPLATRIS